MVASIWDGIANFIAGVLVDRGHDRVRYGALLVAGARPLGPDVHPDLSAAGRAAAAGRSPAVFVAHLLFRTAYAGVNVPYLAMSARISPDPGDRAFVAGHAHAVRHGGRGDGRACAPCRSAGG